MFRPPVDIPDWLVRHALRRAGLSPPRGHFHFVPLMQGRHQSFRIETERDVYVLKLYAQWALHNDNEILLRQLGTAAHGLPLRCLLAHGQMSQAPGLYFALFEWVEGVTLDLALDLAQGSPIRQQLVSAWAQGVLACLEVVFRFSTSRFGFLDGSLRGSHPSWRAFLIDYQQPTMARLNRVAAGRKYVDLPGRLFSRLPALLGFQKPVLCPLDSNLRNFIVDRSGDLILIDPGTVISGPREAAYGELLAQTYSTPLQNPVLDSIKDRGLDLDLVRAFALLSSLNVLAHVAELRSEDFERAGPWGGSRSFHQLIDDFSKQIF